MKMLAGLLDARRWIRRRAVRISRNRFAGRTAVVLACMTLLLGAHLWSVRDPILRAQNAAKGSNPQGEVIRPTKTS
jgi:hypothetical protein